MTQNQIDVFFRPKAKGYLFEYFCIYPINISLIQIVYLNSIILHWIKSIC